MTAPHPKSYYIAHAHFPIGWGSIGDGPCETEGLVSDAVFWHFNDRNNSNRYPTAADLHVVLIQDGQAKDVTAHFSADCKARMQADE
jgi:hypothetical protein